jgi:hypothetical protein
MDIKDFKVNQSVFVLNMHIGRLREPDITEDRVVKIGKKYLYASNGRKYKNTENPYALTEHDSCRGGTLLCPTRTAAESRLEEYNLRRWINKISWNESKGFTLEQLRQVKQILD